MGTAGRRDSRMIEVEYDWGVFNMTCNVTLPASDSVAEVKARLRQHGYRLASAQGAPTPTLSELDLQAHLPASGALPSATMPVTSIEHVNGADSLRCSQRHSKPRHRGGLFEGATATGRQMQGQRR